MPTPTGTINFEDMREEGRKTSWVTPSYPVISTHYQLGSNAFIGWDTNNLLGHDFDDGSYSHLQNQGWDTFKRPRFQWLRMHQYQYDFGVRLAWKTNLGDAIRSGYAIYRSQTRLDVVNGASSALIAFVRYAPEYNTSADLLTRYCDVDVIAGGGDNSDRRVKGVKPTVTWDDVNAHGDYVNILPDSLSVYDATLGEQDPELIISFVDTGAGGSLAGTTWYYSIQPIDGRQFHTLGSGQAPSPYVINNPTTIGNYSKGNVEIGTTFALGDTKAPDNGINVFSGYNGISVIKGAYSASVEPTNLYYPYLGGSLGQVWYAISTNTSAIDPPNGWTLKQGLPIQETGLNPQTSYKVWLAPYTEGDGNSPTQPYEDLVFTTTAAAGPDAPTNARVTGQNHPSYTLEWDYDFVNTPVQPVEFVIFYNNETTGTDSGQVGTGSTDLIYTLQVTDFTTAGDTYKFSIFAKDSSGNLSDGAAITYVN